MADRQIDFLNASDALQTSLYGLRRCHEGLEALGQIMQDADNGNAEVSAWMDQLVLLLPEIAARIEQHRTAAESAFQTIDEIHRDATGMRRTAAPLGSV